MTTPVRVALIGAGRIGSRHAQNLAHDIAEAELAVIADAIPTAAQHAAETVGLERWTADTASVIDDPAIDAVAIASSTSTHAPLIIAAAKAGKAIFCEKPIALDLEMTDTALDAVAAAGVKLQIGFQRRFDRGYRRAKELIDAGQLGRLESIRDTMRDPALPPRDYLANCGGLFRDMTIHNFDAVRWLMGAEVTEVYAVGAALVDPVLAEFDDIDTSIVTLTFANGAIAVIDNSRRSGFGYDVRTEIFGSAGGIFVGYQRETPVVQLSGEGVCTDHVQGFLDRFGDAYRDEMRAFIHCVATGQEPEVTGADARADLALAYAAETSRREHRPVSPQAFARGKQS